MDFWEGEWEVVLFGGGFRKRLAVASESCDFFRVVWYEKSIAVADRFHPKRNTIRFGQKEHRAKTNLTVAIGDALATRIPIFRWRCNRT